jgi:SAM-dependent methyltransferase
VSADPGFERTAAAYDRTPYRSIAYPDTRPAHLAAVAHLLGIAAPVVPTARVLEIGCAGGGNIIPLAATFPEGRFVGVDLSQVQIDEAQQRAAAAGLGNIGFRRASATDIDESWGTFDYIVCHGVYSWVPAEVRRTILTVMAERLADDGLAVVSYNVLPGWHLKRVARDIMLAGAERFADPAHKLAEARSFLEVVNDRVAPQTPYGVVVRAEAAFLAEQRDDYVTHDYLAPENLACTVIDFLGEAGAAGLSYLADADTLLPETVGTGLAAALRQLAGDRLPQLEHYLDLVIGRTFRQSILTRSPGMATAQRAFDPARLAGLHVSAAWQSAGPGVFVDSEGRKLTVEGPEAARALAALGALWPNSATAAQLAKQAQCPVPLVLDALFQAMQEGMLALSSVPVRVGGADAAFPVAWPLARADAARGAPATANPHHIPIELDGSSRALLPLMDGTRDRAALAGPILAMVQQGVITLRRDGKPVEDVAELRVLVGRIVEGAIRSLASAGLLMS